MKSWPKLILLTVIDFVIIWLWVWETDPDPSVAIGILLLVPFVIGLNLIIAAIFYFTNRKYAMLFVINSLISGVLMYYLFGNGIDRHQRLRLESWKFNIKDTTFVITHWKRENTFSISESTNPGSSTVFLDGQFTANGNDYYLTTDSTKYQIKNEYFYGFRNSIDSIKLSKIYR